MTSRLNPFPDYAVTRLAVGQDARVSTVVTPPIAAGRKLVDTYLSTSSAPTATTGSNAALCAIRGDYGTGKTHLLNDVAAYVQQQCSGRKPPSILRATCLEAEALIWFQTKLGPALDTLPLYDIALELYGRAGMKVANSTTLTASAVEVLQQDPARIRDMIRSNQLSIDEVTREFVQGLGEICKGYDSTVRSVLARLVSSETDDVARAWIRGEMLSERTADLLRAPRSIASADQASSVIGAIAAMHKAVGRPFIVLIDEYEHFVRCDAAHGSSANATWLKRLLEQLGDAGALALVAGHWSAWTTAKDYLDRFPQYAPIDLVKLEAKDILQILSDLLEKSHRVDQGQAQVLAAVTDGNMRRVMSLCNLLFRQSGGFSVPLTSAQIHEAWTSVAQRISQDQALEQIMDMLAARGFASKATEGTSNEVRFDLVAERKDGRKVLVGAKHSTTQRGHYDAARLFIDKLKSAGGFAPGVVAMFLANGSIDDELLSILKGSGNPNLRWFDLTDRAALEKIRTEIAAIDGPAPSAKAAAPVASHAAESLALKEESAKLRAMNAELERKLHKLDERRNQETHALKERLDQLASHSTALRLESVRREVQLSPERAHASYEAMLEEPSVSKKLRYLGAVLPIGVFYLAFGLLVVTSGAYGIPGVHPVLLGFGGLLVGLAGAWVIWRRYSEVEEYFDFSRQTLRDLYVREVPIESLMSVNATLLDAITRFTPRLARDGAVRELLENHNLPESAGRYFRESYRR